MNKEIWKEVKIHQSNISKCCLEKSYTTEGFIFKYS